MLLSKLLCLRVPDFSLFVGRLVVPPKRRSPWLRYGLAVVLPIVAVILNVLIFDLHHAPYFGLFMASVAITSLFGGLDPGQVDTIFSAVFGFLIAPPAWTIRLSEPEDRVRIALFVVLGVLMSLVVAVVGELQRKVDRERLALRESENRFRLFMDNSPVIAWVKDATRQVCLFQQSF